MIYVGIVIAIAVVVYLMRKKKPTEQPKQDNPKIDESTVTVSPTIKDGEKVIVAKDGVKTKGAVKIMSQGFQVFDADGNIVVDVTTQMAKYIGEFETGLAHGEIADERLKHMDIWAMVVKNTVSDQYIYVPADDPNQTFVISEIDEAYLDFSSDKGVISWRFKYEEGSGGHSANHKYYPVNSKIIFGVY